MASWLLNIRLKTGRRLRAQRAITTAIMNRSINHPQQPTQAAVITERTRQIRNLLPQLPLSTQLQYTPYRQVWLKYSVK